VTRAQQGQTCNDGEKTPAAIFKELSDSVKNQKASPYVAEDVPKQVRADPTSPKDEAGLIRPNDAVLSALSGKSSSSQAAPNDKPPPSASDTMHTIRAPSICDVGMSLKRWLLDELAMGPETRIANIKGYGSGIQNKDYHSNALLQLRGFQVIVFDGDWQKDDSFTSLVQPFLAEDRSRRAVGFRKSEGNLEGFLTSWKESRVFQQASQMVLALIPAEFLSAASNELRELGVTEDAMEVTAMGWLTLRACGSSHAVSVGGGPSTLNEAKACLKLPPGEVVPWTVLNVGRVTKNGEESPTELVALAPQLLKQTTIEPHAPSRPAPPAHHHVPLASTVASVVSASRAEPAGASSSMEAAKVYAARNAELGRCLAEITADLQRACIISSSCKSSLRSGSSSPLKRDTNPSSPNSGGSPMR